MTAPSRPWWKGLAAWRQRQGWTQRDLADRVVVDPVTVSRWERGAVDYCSRRDELIALGYEMEGAPVYSDLEQRLEALERRVSALDGGPPGGGGRVPLDRAAAQAALEKGLEDQPSPGPSSTGRRRRRGGDSSA